METNQTESNIESRWFWRVDYLIIDCRLTVWFWEIVVTFFAFVLEGHLISKCHLLTSVSSKKRTKTRRMVVKTNSFVQFLEEFTAWQFAFEINCPLNRWLFLNTYLNQFSIENQIRTWKNVKILYYWVFGLLCGL